MDEHRIFKKTISVSLSLNAKQWKFSCFFIVSNIHYYFWIACNQIKCKISRIPKTNKLRSNIMYKAWNYMKIEYGKQLTNKTLSLNWNFKICRRWGHSFEANNFQLHISYVLSALFNWNEIENVKMFSKWIRLNAAAKQINALYY